MTIYVVLFILALREIDNQLLQNYLEVWRVKHYDRKRKEFLKKVQAYQAITKSQLDWMEENGFSSEVVHVIGFSEETYMIAMLNEKEQMLFDLRYKN